RNAGQPCRPVARLCITLPSDRRVQKNLTTTVVRGGDKLTEYRFNTGEAVHFFCSVCGIYTFHQRRSNPQQYGVNVACIDGVSPFDFPCVEVNDGVNHPKDGGGGVVGYLRYEKK
ncbi:GFA family protein, partial [Klebsiella pneumoniae]|nr:GFA family protein [Klebsiella pneumoniae]